MKMNVLIIRIFSPILAIILSASAVFSQTRTAVTDGPWSSPATWGGASVPTSANAVVINNGVDVTVSSVNAACSSITFGSASGSITVNTGLTLSVTNTILLKNTSNASTSASLGGAGSINCAS